MYTTIIFHEGKFKLIYLLINIFHYPQITDKVVLYLFHQVEYIITKYIKLKGYTWIFITGRQIKNVYLVTVNRC